jgi:uncharacterized RDD family membrane protein YckC
MDLNLPKERVYKRNASIIRRLLAFIVDLLVINLVIIWPFRSLLTKIFSPLMQNPFLVESIPSQAYVAIAIIAVIALLYFTLFEYSLNQTIGMSLLNLYAEGNITFFTTIIRNLFIIPFFPFYILWIVDPLHLIFTGERFTERITRTSTVEFTK